MYHTFFAILIIATSKILFLLPKGFSSCSNHPRPLFQISATSAL